MIAASVTGAWSTARPILSRPVAARWEITRALGRQTLVVWGAAGTLDQVRALRWDQLSPLDLGRLLMWDRHRPQDGAECAQPWGQVPARDLAQTLAWDRSIRPRDLRLSLIYNPAPAWKDARVRVSTRRSDELGPRRDSAAALRASLYIPSVPVLFEFGGTPYWPTATGPVFFDFRHDPPPQRIQPVDSGEIRIRQRSARQINLGRRLPWGRARVLDGRLTGIDYGDYPGPVKPLPEPPPDPTVKDTYMIINTVNLVVLPSRTPVEAANLRVSLDADSYSWSFSADILTRAALDLVRPGPGGAKEVELDINGWKWVFVVERYTRQLKFAREAYSISGSSRSQLLAEPYAPVRTGLNGAPINAGQAAEEQLLYTGFSLSWQATDWTFPAGAMSYQSQTPMQVIARLAETVGAIVRPARDADELEVLPRYPAPPWEWQQVDAPISRIIPPVMMTELNGEWTPQPAWNACYTSGTAHGCSMLVRRAGTAGDEPTPDVYDDWLTDQPANQARGLHELSKGGDIEIVGFTVPLFPAADDHGVGLILPGELCKVPEDSGAWVGLCLSVEISAAGTGAVEVKQQIKLERNHTWQP